MSCGTRTPPSGYAPATDTSIYDALGQRIAVQQTEQLGTTVSSTTRVFSYDGDGQILSRRDGTVSGGVFTALSGSTTANPDAMAPQHYVYAEGHSVASLSEAGLIQTSDGLTPYSDPQSSGTYTVQAGDTLQSIAQTVYGNSNLWYVIADANAISLDSSGNAINLVAGTTLKLPAVSNSQNSSQTFTPYNPLKLIGSTTPALAYIPPPPQQHCNDLTTLIVVAVTAIVTYETMGATSGVLESELGATGSLMASAAIGGAVGSAAGQLTADALGVSTGFSLDQALTQGLANGLTAGLTSGLQGSDLSALEQGGKLTTLGNLADGAGSYAAGVAAAAIVGEPTQFSWAGMAAAALATAGTARSGLPTNAESSLGPSTAGFAQNLAGRLVNGTLDRELSLALGDTRVPSLRQIGLDAFGNALGKSAAQWISNEEWTQVAPSAQKAADAIVGGIMGGGSSSNGSTSPDYALLLNPDRINQILGNDPQLAAIDQYSAAAGVSGLPGSVDVTVGLLNQEGPTQNALLAQLGYDAQWMSYAHNLGVTAQDPSSIESAQAAYNVAAGDGSQYSAAAVFRADDAIDTMIENNGWSFGPAQPAGGVPVLGTVTVTGSAGDAGIGVPNFQLPAVQLPTIQFTGPQISGLTLQGPDLTALKSNPWLGVNGQGSPGWMNAAGTGLGVLSTVGDSSELAGEQLHALYLGVDLGQDGAYTQALLATRGSVPLSAPLSGVAQTGEAAQAAAADANTVGVLVDFGKIESVLKPLGTLAGLLSGSIDLYQAGQNYLNGNYGQAAADVGHGLFTAGLIVVDAEVSVPLGLADLAVQHYSYQGQTGWTALCESMQASQRGLYQQNPTLYNQMWTGFKE